MNPSFVALAWVNTLAFAAALAADHGALVAATLLIALGFLLNGLRP